MINNRESGRNHQSSADKSNSFRGRGPSRIRDRKEKRSAVITRSLFRKQDDIEDALTLLGIVFSSPDSYQLEKKWEGLYAFEDVLVALKSLNSGLDYLNSTHLVELFLRDPEGILRVDGGYIGRRLDNIVEPPPVLYFGTTENYAEQMRRRGILSQSKGFVRLYEGSEEAARFAKRFSSNNDPGTVLAIDSAKAFSMGINFSASGRPGEYLTSQISPNLIMEVPEKNA